MIKVPTPPEYNDTREQFRRRASSDAALPDTEPPTPRWLWVAYWLAVVAGIGGGAAIILTEVCR